MQAQLDISIHFFKVDKIRMGELVYLTPPSIYLKIA